MANLAIRGHATRGKEVVEILEMLGGKSYTGLAYKGEDPSRLYCINNENNFIDSPLVLKDVQIFSLEKFLEKFPYKVGDKVYYQPIPQINSVCISEIISMRWIDGSVVYYTSNGHEIYACDLQPYEEENYCQVIGIGNDTSSNGINTSASLINEETMEEKEPEPKAPILSNRYDYAKGKCGYVIPDGYEFDSIKQGFRTEIILRPIKSQYPKTYEECCDVLKIEYPYFKTEEDGISASTYKNKLFGALKQLLICRDAYWKIAGKQMELGKPWEPDWKECRQPSHCIFIEIDNFKHLSHILAFPTKEMRDAFYENFKDLIEQCKELL